MNFSFKHTFSGRNFFILGVIFILLTLLSIYILSSMITQVAEKASTEITKGNFLKRDEIVQKEFFGFLQMREELERIIEVSDGKNLEDHLRIFSTLQTYDSLVKNTWFQIGDNKIRITDTSTANIEAELYDLLSEHGEKELFTTIVHKPEQFYWRIYFSLVKKNKPKVRYGFDVDLYSLQSYFSNVGRDIPNYAFVFDEKGTVIYHPEVKLMGKNVFQLTNLNAADTTFINDDFYGAKVAPSEYLKLDILRYTKRLNLPTTTWYISANSPKEIGSENVNAVRKYAALIYVITTSILILFFYLFTHLNKKSFKEKSLLSEEKNRLLVENEKINKEKAIMQLQQIKEQINPHFLFNSLNSLYMLIESDTAVARKFTLNLSKIYRYLINPPDSNLVTLQEEMFFIEKYIFLHQIRFTKELIFKITVANDNLLFKKVPYLSFQIIIENAIKHNIASEEIPLEIIIEITENHVCISNSLNERPFANKGSQFGHKYLRSIYLYHSKNDFQAYKKDGKFTCILPLIG